jgi:hypothetical protein
MQKHREYVQSVKLKGSEQQRRKAIICEILYTSDFKPTLQIIDLFHSRSELFNRKSNALR